MGSIPESGRSAGEGNGNPLQCSCLGNFMESLVATVHGVAKGSDTTEGTKKHHLIIQSLSLNQA